MALAYERSDREQLPDLLSKVLDRPRVYIVEKGIYCDVSS